MVLADHVTTTIKIAHPLEKCSLLKLVSSKPKVHVIVVHVVIVMKVPAPLVKEVSWQVEIVAWLPVQKGLCFGSRRDLKSILPYGAVVAVATMRLLLQVLLVSVPVRLGQPLVETFSFLREVLPPARNNSGKSRNGNKNSTSGIRKSDTIFAVSRNRDSQTAPNISA